MKDIYAILTFLLGSFFFGLISCDLAPSNNYQLNIPPGFPEPEIPEDNLLTAERVELGRKLFYEPLLSRDSSISCGTCHLLSKGMADHKRISVGIKNRKGNRNVPTLTNIAYQPYLFMEGGSPTLEMQLLGPIQEHSEMDLTISESVARLKTIPSYQDMAKEAYGREMGAFVLSRSLAAFERTMISGNSPFDKSKYQGDTAAMTESQQRGMRLFFSPKTQCMTCHSGFNFTDYTFQNIGLYQKYEDKGRMRVTQDSSDAGKFKVPTLRNVALTHPYMHDGSIRTLEEVLDHYESGGFDHPNKAQQIFPLDLSETDKADLISFLHALTDSAFITNKDFLAPED